MTKQEIGAILMKLREKAGKSREEVAELLGKSVKTIGHWETGYAQPDANTLFLLCIIYDADLNTSFGFPSSNLQKEKAPPYSGEALKVAKDYDGLDHHGKTITRMVISEEQKRMDAEAATQNKESLNIIPFIPKKKTTRKGIVTLEVYEEPSAAGTGNYVSNAPISHMEQYPEEYVPSHTDFGVIISGQSMEPKYPDKAVVFLRSTQVVEPGEIGIFLLDGQAYIKELRVDPDTGSVFLHSLNPMFSDIEVTPYADFRPQGKVLGGYDPTEKAVIWNCDI